MDGQQRLSSQKLSLILFTSFSVSLSILSSSSLSLIPSLSVSFSPLSLSIFFTPLTLSVSVFLFLSPPPPLSFSVAKYQPQPHRAAPQWSRGENNWNLNVNCRLWCCAASVWGVCMHTYMTVGRDERHRRKETDNFADKLPFHLLHPKYRWTMNKSSAK